MKTHTGEKSNKCSLCDYATSHAGNLKTHMKTHTGEKSNKCSLCEYATSHTGSLKTHMKLHTGEKSFKCSLCEYSAGQKTVRLGPAIIVGVFLHTVLTVRIKNNHDYSLYTISWL